MAGTWWRGKGELREEQIDVIDLPADGNYLVTGPPGSGKTNILLLRANYLTLLGKSNLLIVVFTKTLQQFIASGGRGYDFAAEKIVTSRKMLTDLLFQYGRTVVIPDGFEEARAYLAEQVANLVSKERLGKVYDAILLDEAQDYTPQEIKLFSKLSERLFAVADSRQKIYTGEDPLDTLRAIVTKALPLVYHYRNGLQICKLADGLAKETEGHEKLIATCQYNEEELPSSVAPPFRGDLAAQSQQIISSLMKQVRAYPGEHLAVICPKNEALTQVWHYLNQDAELAPKLCLVGEDVTAFDDSKPICVCTIHAAKGLEARAVHIAAADGLKKFQQQRKLAFTGVTRAKTSLAIYHEGDLPGYLQSAIDGLNPPKGKPPIDSLFGRKK
jgi:superfamily I DNA/RNA helicase